MIRCTPSKVFQALAENTSAIARPNSSSRALRVRGVAAKYPPPVTSTLSGANCAPPANTANEKAIGTQVGKLAEIAIAPNDRATGA
jgi:hypothetical protein